MHLQLFLSGEIAGELELDDLEAPFQTKLFCDSMN